MLNFKKKISLTSLDEEQNIISKKISELKPVKGFSQFVLYAISELFANINEHSKAKNAFIELKIDKEKCLIKISDDGKGLRKSYNQNKIYPKDDFSAIEFALSGLSTKNFRERGFGLYSVKKLALALGGEMVIESGKAKATIQKENIKFNHLKKDIKGLSITLKTNVREINFYKHME
ncbi:MAG: ATP-binding protein [Bacteroidetes bacterium]|nr:MAG: ATP-binding protein [Bacteroidota bacterium]